MLLTDSYGSNGVFCWVANVPNVPRLKNFTIFYYSLTWLIILLNCYFVVKLICMLKIELQGEKELVQKYTSKLRLYPVVQIVSFVPATVNRIYGLANPYSPDDFTLTLIQLIFDSLTGLMFSIVYGFNASVKNALADCFCCKKNSGSQISESLETQQKSRNKSLTYLDDTILTE